MGDTYVNLEDAVHAAHERFVELREGDAVLGGHLDAAVGVLRDMLKEIDAALSRVPADGEDGRMFTFTTSSEPPEARVVCKNCGDGAAGDRPRDVFPWADTHFCGPADGPEDRGFWKPEQI